MGVKKKAKSPPRSARPVDVLSKPEEDFCQHYFDTNCILEAALEVGISRTQGYVWFRKRPIQDRIEQISQQYKDLAGRARVRKAVEEDLVKEGFVDFQLMQMAKKGEGKGKHGRLRACFLLYQKLGLVEQNPQVVNNNNNAAAALAGGTMADVYKAKWLVDTEKMMAEKLKQEYLPPAPEEKLPSE